MKVMLLHLQFPFLDARHFVNHSANMLQKPSWPDPFLGEFIRCFGCVIRRGDFPDWIPEPKACNARKAFKLNKLTSPLTRGKEHRVYFSPVAKRIYFDGTAMGKIELVFRAKQVEQLEIKRNSIRQLLSTLKNHPVKAKVYFHKKSYYIDCSLGNYRTQLPIQWISATANKHNSNDQDRNKYWVASGTPLVTLHAWQSKPIRFPGATNRWQCNLSYKKEIRKLSVGFWQRKNDNQIGDFWVIANQKHDHDFGRAFRLTLLRLHSETSAMRLMCKFLASDEFDFNKGTPAYNLLDEYLHENTKRIRRLQNSFEETPTDIINLVNRVKIESAPSEIDLVLMRLKNILLARHNYFGFISSLLTEKNETQLTKQEGMNTVIKYYHINANTIGSVGDGSTSFIVPEFFIKIYNKLKKNAKFIRDWKK